ncbi:single-stranded DNA-binding protein [Deinococcus sp. DB0503]|uniref:single-stranded DNA-binding protein n=1 Tax=Deinococcus sp. DB0503 TaxID=2479203 RepID=UPI0018DFC07C|nr:single-stranded DNA-binding protein [Deinococcus sp. DB0503]MBI0446986.1 single-stranded DNA-binding protein [Deinococcus sp. DB0503]
MALGLNRVILIGRLAEDAALRYTPSGVAVLEGTLHGQEELFVGESVRMVEWYHRFEQIGKAAEYSAERPCVKGTPMVLDGSLEYSEWEAPEGGKRSALKVKALQLAVLDVPADAVLGLNQVLVSGHLARDVVLRHTAAKEPVLELRLGLTNRFRDRQGQPQEKTHWLDVVLWRQLALAQQGARKGTGVVVEGRLFNEAWTDREGNKRLSTKVEARRVVTLARGTPNVNTPEDTANVA